MFDQSNLPGDGSISGQYATILDHVAPNSDAELYVAANWAFDLFSEYPPSLKPKLARGNACAWPDATVVRAPTTAIRSATTIIGRAQRGATRETPPFFDAEGPW
ncbi:hypothetical protein GOSPT_125_00740 [Gordonia sputi NBRC 100414]|uniref:Uncharacterized protein n=1 Tax=Gordonia sputi NBRC 100414 TaxID=1089453 RepID=H5U6E9_9ACTN|nr:hypothetical protein GOSPT_125_00740 [Gordonia sputi NBRC 100414]